MASCHTQGGGTEGPDVLLIDQGGYILLDNGIIQVTISNPLGIVTSIGYNGISNWLEILNKERNRGYWDLNWSQPDGNDNFDVPSGSECRIIANDKDNVEVSFKRYYNAASSTAMVPLNIDKRFILRRGNSGFYTYGIYERPSGLPDFNLNQTRVTFKLRKDKFNYMAIADNKQRIMPSPDDRSPEKCQQLAYPEAVILTNPKNPDLDGEVDDKYQYSCDNKDNRVHGWISFDPLIGFWIITPSNEFRNGGPLKQDLTSHVGPTCLSMFHSSHYAGETLCAKFRNGEPWQKVFGPVFIYMNMANSLSEPYYLWHDAKMQMLAEVASWPYDWPASSCFSKADERGSVLGKLLVQDRFISQDLVPGSYAFLGLAEPGEKGSWQLESKGYQFWAQADEFGQFRIDNICAGTYDLYGWVSGVLGDYKREQEVIKIYPGSVVDLGDIIYQPPRDGPTLWEIGVPDRTAAEFFIPDPNPKYVNRLYTDHPEKYRQYGLWERYSEIYPNNDLVFTVGTSNWSTDWFFIQGCRLAQDGSLKPTTWQIIFQLDEIKTDGLYKLRIAIAASNVAAIQVRVNNPASNPLFDTSQFGKDNTIARHGIHGLYSLWTVEIAPGSLQKGKNSIFLTQRKLASILSGVMYDYIRLEQPGGNIDTVPLLSAA